MPSRNNLVPRKNPNEDQKPYNYDDDSSAHLDPNLFSFLLLEKKMSKDAKIKFSKDRLDRVIPKFERAQRQEAYKQKLLSGYQPLHEQLYEMDATSFFVPSFIQAVSKNTEKSIRSIMSEPSPGIYTFAMFQPKFCELLIAEVENFEQWAKKINFRVMKPNILSKHGIVLDDFGLETMLDELMEKFICPISKVFFPEVGGSSLDWHHGFVTQYGCGKDVDLDIHVDNSEVTLNVCLGKEFSAGELYFCGVRCEKHLTSGTLPEERLEYSHVPGQAVLHLGCNRHGARPIASGHRICFIMWCKSSVFREMKNCRQDHSGWCGECRRTKKEMLKQSDRLMKLIEEEPYFYVLT